MMVMPDIAVAKPWRKQDIRVRNENTKTGAISPQAKAFRHN